MTEPLEDRYHEDRRNLKGSSGDVNENIGRDSVRGNVTNNYGGGAIALLLERLLGEDPSKKSRNLLKKLLKAFAIEISIRLKDNLQQNFLQVYQYLELPMSEQADAVGRPQHQSRAVSFSKKAIANRGQRIIDQHQNRRWFYLFFPPRYLIRINNGESLT